MTIDGLKWFIVPLFQNNAVWEGKQEPVSDEEAGNVQAAKQVESNKVIHYSIGKSEPPDCTNVAEEPRQEPKQPEKNTASETNVPR